MVLLAALMMLGFTVFELLTSTLMRRFEKGLYKVVLSGSLIFLLVLPIAYIMYVLGDSSVLQTSYTIEEASNSSSNLLTAISVGGSEITNTYGYYGVDGGEQLLVGAQTLAIPLFVFALLSVFVRKYWMLTIPLVMAISLNIFMAMGPNQAMGGVFTFLFDNISLINSVPGAVPVPVAKRHVLLHPHRHHRVELGGDIRRTCPG